MGKRTIISFTILFVLTCLLLGFSIVVPDLWLKSLSHWIIIPAIALTITLLIGLVLMDDIFELDYGIVITPKKLKVKIEIKKYLMWAFLIVCFGSIILELIQFFFNRITTNWLDPVTAIAGSVLGIILHIMGSKWLMKRVEFELERWENNVL